ncbi:MAG: zeta toxin family protein [Azoarcus sp.]|jgi:predicted ABC-type ATPase|nr:zeta toxin family protein [Azoarcus sp.]
MPKKIIIIAGPHGTGKTLFAHSFLPAEAACVRFINANLIAAGLSPFAPEDALARANRLVQEEIHDSARYGKSFAFETTLPDPGYAQIIPKWQKAGYRVYLYFLQLANADLAVARVAERVRQGGHNVPEEVIRQNFETSQFHFEHNYRENVDTWATFDCSGQQPRFLAFGENMTPAMEKRWAASAWQSRLTEQPHAPAWRSIIHTDINDSTDPDLHGSCAALQRAAEVARQIAIQTKTSLVLSRKNGKLLRISANVLKKQAQEQLLAHEPKAGKHPKA